MCRHSPTQPWIIGKKTLNILNAKTVKNRIYTGINWGCAFLAKILFNIRIIISKIGQSRTPHAPRKHAHTMTGRGFDEQVGNQSVYFNVGLGR